MNDLREIMDVLTVDSKKSVITGSLLDKSETVASVLLWDKDENGRRCKLPSSTIMITDKHSLTDLIETLQDIKKKLILKQLNTLREVTDAINPKQLDVSEDE